MRFTVEVGYKERSRIELSRNWFTGAMQILVNGEQVARQSWLLPSTHFGFARKRRHEFGVGKVEKHRVVIERERPLIIAGIRPHTYRVFVDGELIYEQSGY
ncbi:MAG TPA: hypothetical protein VGG51_10325 [Candidatus Cybelea sp.]|jgi:hypothetical protein